LIPLRPAALLLSLLAPLAARPADPPRRSLAVAAAANLKPALEALAKAFEAEQGVQVIVTLGASGNLFAQIQNGAPIDVFLSADRDYPRKLVEAGLADEQGEVLYAVGKLVVWTPAGSRIDLGRDGLRALASPEVKRIAIANPATAPYGRAAQAALAAEGLTEAVQEKLVIGESVGQVSAFAASGNVEAAFLPLSLALAPELAGGHRLEVPARLHPPLEQSAVVVRAAREPALARSFLAFLTGARGRGILSRSGYAAP